MQSTVVKSYYLINLLFSIIFHYFHYYYFIITIIIHIFAVKSGTHSVVTLLWGSKMCFHLFHSINCLVLFHSSGVHGPFGFVILHLDAAHKIFRGYVWPGDIWVVFGWYLGHLESPIKPVIHLVLMWITDIFIFSKFNL